MAQPIDYFAYASLLDQRRMRELAGEWDNLSTARLRDHRLRFSIWSEVWRGATADIEPAVGEDVYGVIYGLFRDQFQEILRRHPGYIDRHVVVETGDGLVTATALVVASPEEGHRPSKGYVQVIDEGMRQHGFAPEIRRTLWRWASLPEPGRL